MKIIGVLVHVGLTVAMLALLNGTSLVVKDLGLVVRRLGHRLGVAIVHRECCELFASAR